MVCIYCGSKTQVTNSRPQRRLNSTWRRRECTSCGAIFTTLERADLSASVRVRKQSGALEPFSRDRLLLDIAASLGHRSDAVSVAGPLCDTITAQTQKTHPSPVVGTQDIALVAVEVLSRYDATAAVYFRAYHSS